MAVLISQKTTDNHSYFYDNDNYIVQELPKNAYYNINEEFVYNYFNVEEINELKTKNDWNKEIVEENLFEASIIDHKVDTITLEQQSMVFPHISDKDIFSILVTTDKNGNSLYFMREEIFDNKIHDYVYLKSYLVMFSSDGTYDSNIVIMEVKDLWNYREELREFKIQNNWGFGD